MPGADTTPTVTTMTERRRILDNARGSVRLEGLRPSANAQQLAAAWAQGAVSDEDLIAAEQRLLASAAARAQGRPS